MNWNHGVRAAAALVTFWPALSTAQITPNPLTAAVTSEAALRRGLNIQRASSAGVDLAVALRDVSIPDGTVAEADIRTMASQSRSALDALFLRKKKTQSYLGLTVALGDALTKGGQFVGGGGAMLFGFQASNTSSSGAHNSARNAAYSGTLAAGVTLLQQLFNLDAKKKAESACKSLDGKEFELGAQTRAWELQAPDPAYRSGFVAGDFKKFNDEVTSLSEACFS